MAEIKQKSLKLNATLNMIKTLMGVLFPLITFPYSSRILGPEGTGKVQFANSIISYFAMLAALGISNYATREAAKIRDNKIELNKFCKEILSINMISTLVAYLLFLIALFLVPSFKEYKVLLCIFSCTILFNTIGIDWLYRAFEDFAYITIRSIIFQIISMVLLFTTVKTSEDVVQYAALMVVSSVGSNLLNFINSRKYINLFQKTKLELKKHLKPIFVLFAMAVTISIYTALDTSMLGFIADDKQVGLYSAATKINKIVLSLVTAVGAVLLPRLSYYAKNEDKTEFYKLAYKGFEILFMLAIPCTIGLCIISKPIMILLSGEKFLEAIPVMRIMNPIILIIGLSNFIGIQIFMPLGKENWTLYSVIGGAVTNFSLNLILIPKYGAMGAGISTLCAEGTVSLIQIVLAQKFIKIFTVIKSLLKNFINSIIMAIPVCICAFFVENMLLSVSSGICLGAIVYFALLVIEKNEIVTNILDSITSKLKRKQ